MNKTVLNSNIDKGISVRASILHYITTYIQEHGYCPSVREIGEGVGLKSSSSVQTHLKRMMEEGYLETDAEFGTPRAIRVPGYTFTKESPDQIQIKISKCASIIVNITEKLLQDYKICEEVGKDCKTCLLNLEGFECALCEIPIVAQELERRIKESL